MRDCPECGQHTLHQSMREDYCQFCDYSQRYEDAYAASDPGGDFEGAEIFKDEK